MRNSSLYSTFSSVIFTSSLLLLSACSKDKSMEENKQQIVDTLITNGQVYTGAEIKPQALDVAICGSEICGLYPSGEHHVKAKFTVDASGKVVSPGFIDPHTHSLEELYSKDKNSNLNYLTQGVTTVVNGNDGEGPVDVAKTASELEANGIGTNVALLVGHGSVREQVMGRAQRFASTEELKAMSQLLTKAMKAGALGLSTGLYYVPGSFANTDEVVTLAKIASKYGGIYDTHLRDESTFNIGFLAALDEAMHIADAANIHLHLAHIKALGVDVWGQSTAAIAKIEQAQANGISVSADQYPWLASGTKLHSAVMPKWVMADSQQAFHQRLNDESLAKKLSAEIKENIRRRGGPKSLLITAFKNAELVGLNLAQVADKRATDPVTAAIKLVQEGEVRVASFNMSPTDVEAFMVKPWVVTSSDGTNGHPRKFASFPQKYQKYVQQKGLLTLGEFIKQSSSKTAKILGFKDRGELNIGYQADIIIFDANNFAANADFSVWNKYSSGVEYVWLNGQLVIKDRRFENKLAGKFVY
jgi:N-acyl-D-aspartate/D-glutamate deacylase